MDDSWHKAEVHAEAESEANTKEVKMAEKDCIAVESGAGECKPAINGVSESVAQTESGDVNNHATEDVAVQSASECGESTAAHHRSAGESVTSEKDSDAVNTSVSTNDVEIAFKLVYCKQQFDVNVRSSTRVSELRVLIGELTGVPPANQKLNYRATLLRDEQTVGDAGVVRGAKLMLIGSRPAEIGQVTASRSDVQADKEVAAATGGGSAALSSQDVHRRVLEKYGKPEDVLPGFRSANHALPSVPLSGMLNKRGAKVRLTFKLETDELWIGTNERTEKVPMHSIRSVLHEPIVGHEEYSLVGLQLGSTELSLYWLYWVPSQYVRAIRNTILKP